MPNKCIENPWWILWRWHAQVFFSHYHHRQTKNSLKGSVEKKKASDEWCLFFLYTLKNEEETSMCSRVLFRLSVFRGHLTSLIFDHLNDLHLHLKKCWKNVSKLGNNSSKFRESVVKIRPQYDWISKIPSRGWQAWKTWFSTLMTFLDSVIFRYFFKISWIKIMTGAKKIIKVKNQFFHACQPREWIFEVGS